MQEATSGMPMCQFCMAPTPPEAPQVMILDSKEKDEGPVYAQAVAPVISKVCPPNDSKYRVQ